MHGFCLLAMSGLLAQPANDTPEQHETAKPYLVRVITDTRGCATQQALIDWLPCLREGEKIVENEILLLLDDPPSEGVIVQRQREGKGHGNRYWAPAHWLRELAVREWREMEVGKIYRLPPDVVVGSSGIPLFPRLGEKEALRLYAGDVIRIVEIAEHEGFSWFRVEVQSRENAQGWFRALYADLSRELTESP